MNKKIELPEKFKSLDASRVIDMIKNPTESDLTFGEYITLCEWMTHIVNGANNTKEKDNHIAKLTNENFILTKQVEKLKEENENLRESLRNILA